jgi:hypothetical protein
MDAGSFVSMNPAQDGNAANMPCAFVFPSFNQ